MPEYLSPGVYVEEIEIGSKPVEGVSTSTAGFLGAAERGPTKPQFVTSWLEFQRKFGSYTDASYLPYAVQGFFDNGGQRAYIARVVSKDAVTAQATLKSDEDDALQVSAIGEGEWGNRIAVKVAAGSSGAGTFKISVFYWKKLPKTLYDPEADTKTLPRPSAVEQYDNVTIDPDSSDYYEKKVNLSSNLIRLGAAPTKPVLLPDASAIAYLTGGDDFGGTETKLVLADFIRSDTDQPGQRKGLTALDGIDDISLLYSPNALAVSGLAQALISHSEQLKDRFVVLDSESQKKVDELKPRDDIEDTKYAAFYYPWVKVINPDTGMQQTIPPGGHVLGLYARTDVERGVHKAPANDTLRGVVDLEFQITKGEQDILNPKGVNVIRAFPGRGIRVWGARTLSSDPLWKYVNVRRLFIFLEESIYNGTQWVVFEPNDDKLWARVRRTVNEFLTRIWRDGALVGSKAEEAFFVKVDRSTMTQDDINNGRLIVLIGVAPVRPAEFVIFRIAQLSGSADAQ